MEPQNYYIEITIRLSDSKAGRYETLYLDKNGFVIGEIPVFSNWIGKKIGMKNLNMREYLVVNDEKTDYIIRSVHENPRYKNLVDYQERSNLEEIRDGLKMQLRRLEHLKKFPEACEIIKKALEKIK